MSPWMYIAKMQDPSVENLNLSVLNPQCLPVSPVDVYCGKANPPCFKLKSVTVDVIWMYIAGRQAPLISQHSRGLPQCTLSATLHGTQHNQSSFKNSNRVLMYFLLKTNSALVKQANRSPFSNKPFLWIFHTFIDCF